MEAAGFAFSVLSLAQLFQTAVDCFGYVELGKNFSHDYQSNCLKLVITQLQLTRWGRTVGLCISEADAEAIETSSPGITQETLKQVENILGQIVSLFKRAEKMVSAYDSRPSPMGTNTDEEESEPGIGSLHLRIERICIRRQQRTSHRKKLKWAVYDKQKFESLIQNVQSLVDGLVNLYPPPPAEVRYICEQEASELQAEPALRDLRQIVAMQDRALEDAIVRLSREPKTAIQNNWNNAGGTKINIQGIQKNYGGQTFNF